MSARLEISKGDRRYLLSRRRPPDPEGSRVVRMVDLFSGCGGFSLGILEACRSLGLGLEVALAVEIKAEINRIYEANFTPTAWKGASRVDDWFDADIGASVSARERSARRRLGNIDLLVGGPPCQGHSTLNNHTRGKDPKNGLYLRMVRAAEVLQPHTIVIENVPAIERDSRGVLDTAIARLQSLGYSIDSRLVSVADIGAPQLRRRHMLLAVADGLVEAAFESARIPKPRTLRWAIGDLVGADGAEQIDIASKMSPENARRATWLLRHDAYDLPNHLRPECHQDPSHKYKSMYGRMRWEEPAQTITTGFGSPGQGRYLHPQFVRTITPHEAARLQFFPDWFSFRDAPFRSALSDAIGNAVPVKLGFVAGVAVLSSLAKARRRSVASGNRGVG